MDGCEAGTAARARGAAEFLKEALALLPQKHVVRVLRADSGFLGPAMIGLSGAARTALYRGGAADGHAYTHGKKGPPPVNPY